LVAHDPVGPGGGEIAPRRVAIRDLRVCVLRDERERTPPPGGDRDAGSWLVGRREQGLRLVRVEECAVVTHDLFAQQPVEQLGELADESPWSDGGSGCWIPTVVWSGCWAA
jgi:hypothetical protein